MRRNHLSLVRFACGLSLTGSVLLSGGCQAPEEKVVEPMPSVLGGVRTQPQYIEADTIPARDDVVSIHQFWNPVPWQYDSSDRVVGFRVPVYFVSSETEKGAFVEGDIYAWLNTYEPSRTERAMVKRNAYQWKLNAVDAMNFRVRKKSVMGYYYGMVLSWPPEMDLGGRTIEIEFGYERGDGRVILSSARRFKLPQSPDYMPIRDESRVGDPATSRADDTPEPDQEVN